MGPAPIPLDLHHNTNGCPNPNLDAADRTNEECGIREVWAVNLEDEFRAICQVCFLSFYHSCTLEQILIELKNENV